MLKPGALADRTFVAGLFSSDSDKTIRYIDEGELIDLCRWTVDVGSLPNFQKQAENPPQGGFFTGMEYVSRLCEMLNSTFTCELS